MCDVFQELLKKGYSEEDINRLIKEKKSEFNGYMSEEAILFLVAKELGINISHPELDKELQREIDQIIDYDDFSIDISEVKEGMKLIVVLGRIGKINQIHHFIRKDGTPGVFGSFLIYDNSSAIEVVVWEDQVKLIENSFFKLNEYIRIVGGYAKINKKNILQIHLGKKGRIIISPDNIKPDRIKIKDFNNNTYLKVTGDDELKNSHNTINKFIKEIKAQILQLEDFKEINLKNGEKTFLLKVLLNVDNSIVMLVVWGLMAVEVLKLISEGIYVKIKDVHLKFNSYTSQNEVIFTKKSSLVVL